MSDDVALKPVVAYATGIVGDGVALQLDAATTKGQLAVGEGDPFGFALTEDEVPLRMSGMVRDAINVRSQADAYRR